MTSSCHEIKTRDGLTSVLMVQHLFYTNLQRELVQEIMTQVQYMRHKFTTTIFGLQWRAFCELCTGTATQRTRRSCRNTDACLC